MNKIVSFLSIALMAAVAFSSCIGDSESSNTITAGGYYTITGSNATGYNLFSDLGGRVTPSMESVRALCGEGGFGSHKRAILYFEYTPEMVSEDGTAVVGANLTSGSYMHESAPMTVAEAESAKVTEPDSIMRMTELMEVWASNGYLNASIVGMYYKSAPTLHLVYDPASISENAIKATLYYNYHSKTSNGATYLYYSYPISSWSAMIPGSGDIELTVESEGLAAKKVKIARKALTPIL